MRRPAFYFSIIFASGIYTAWLLQPRWYGWVTTFCILILSRCLLGINCRIPFVLFFCFALGSASFYLAEVQSEKHLEMVDREIVCQGEVLSVTQVIDHASLTVETAKYGKVLIIIYQKKPNYEEAVGKWIVVTGLLELPKTAGNPSGFDYQLYLRSIGISAIMQVQPIDISNLQKVTNLFTHRICLIRNHFEKKLIKQIGEVQAGIAIAMLFGDKSGMEESDYDIFQRNGTAHILSVSGLHVGFVYGILISIFGGNRKPIPNIIIFLLLLCYGTLSGFCPSVDRALLMIGLHMLSNVLCRQYDLLSSAGISAIILLFQNPYNLFHTGFQLSFFAVFLMGWIFPLIAKIIPRKNILSILLPIPLLQATMAPYTAFLFNYFSAGAFLANFGVVFFSGLLIPAGLVGLIAGLFSEPIFHFIAIFIDLCVSCVVWFNEVTYAGGKTCFDVIGPSIWSLIIFYGLFFFLLSEVGRILIHRRRYKRIAFVLLLIVVLSCLLNFKTEDEFDHADAVFVDVGQGDCLHIRTPSGKNILIDGGGKESFDVGKRILKPYLLKNGVKKIDLAISTHLDTDHYGGLRSLAANGMIDVLGLYEGNKLIEPKILNDTGLEKNQLCYLHQGDNIRVDSSVWLEVIYPLSKPRNVYKSELLAMEENPRSLVIRVHLGEYRILMTGDIDSQTEDDVLNVNPSGGVTAEILKIAHHGSKYSTSDHFLDKVNPLVAVFQTGKNSFGHPNNSILEKCKERGIMIYRTDKDGAVGIFGIYDNKAPYIRTIRKGT